MSIYRKRSILVACAGVLAGMLAAGCSKNQAANAPAVQAPPPVGAPAASQVAADRSVAEQHMAQAHEAAATAWRQSHPGQPLPPGL